MEGSFRWNVFGKSYIPSMPSPNSRKFLYHLFRTSQAISKKTAMPRMADTRRSGEWYFEKRGSRKILAGSRNLGSIFDKSRSLVFSLFAFTFFESQNFSPKSLGLGFLTRISVSRRVSDFTIRHPYKGWIFTIPTCLLLYSCFTRFATDSRLRNPTVALKVSTI